MRGTAAAGGSGSDTTAATPAMMVAVARRWRRCESGNGAVNGGVACRRNGRSSTRGVIRRRATMR
ncbi:hypothetical protein Syun_017392 [Stephania yunnanensis]|uniref:Uncharacterized protein n=1 Tax=Stephania yunnanensis TaxID=152371 RepID=A0AAP0J8G4_9MAGN